MTALQTQDVRTESLMKKIGQANATLFRNEAIALDASKHVIVRRHARNNATIAQKRLQKLREELAQ